MGQGEGGRMSYLASLRGEVTATKGEGRWRDGTHFMIAPIEYPIYI